MKKFLGVFIAIGFAMVLAMTVFADSAVVDTTTKAVTTTAKSGIIETICSAIAAITVFLSGWLIKVQKGLKKATDVTETILEGLKLATTTSKELDELMVTMNKTVADNNISPEESQVIIKELQESTAAIKSLSEFIQKLKVYQDLIAKIDAKKKSA